MLVLIDESGDAGFKIAKGSTPFFVVAMVIFREFDEAEQASRAIEAAKSRLRIGQEFKFSKSHANVKDGFFCAVEPFKFTVRALVVEKSRIYSNNLRCNKETFYNYFVRQLLSHDNDVLRGARVKIDGSGDREFKRELSKYLKDQCGHKIAHIKFAESHRDNLIQLADMVAGAIYRSCMARERKDSYRWREMLGSKIEDVWNFR